MGDEEFRRLAAERIDDVRSASGSVVLVTHNMNEIQRFLQSGGLAGRGPHPSRRGASRDRRDLRHHFAAPLNCGSLPRTWPAGIDDTYVTASRPNSR